MRQLKRKIIALGLTLFLGSQLAIAQIVETSYKPSHILQASIIPPYNMETYDEQLQEIYSNIYTNNLSQRITLISRAFINTPYLLGALGEGPDAPFDQNPLYRTDAFDCVTFVDTVLAMAKAKNLEQFKRVILDMRYQSNPPSFFTRAHFISIDWNTSNQKKGYIKDITEQFPVKVRTTHTTINQAGWYKNLKLSNLKLIGSVSFMDQQQLLNELHDFSKKTQTQISTIKYIPLSELFTRENDGTIVPSIAVFNQIPNGAIIEIIRNNWALSKRIGTDLDVSHMGFAIQDSRGLLFRNASSIHARVVDEFLIEYLQHYFIKAKNPNNIGIHIEQPI